MLKVLGSVLAMLLVLQGAVPSLGLGEPLVNIAAVGVSMTIAGLSYYLKPSA